MSLRTVRHRSMTAPYVIQAASDVTAASHARDLLGDSTVLERKCPILPALRALVFA
jgi:hypothetical protein